MDFRVLGPVEVLASARPLPVRGARQRALLAALLLRRGATAGRDRLADELWDDPAGVRGNALQVAVSRLRQGLGPAADRLESTPAGYCLRLQPGELDLERFERLAAEGRSALDAGDAGTAAARLRAALSEWRGAALAGIGDAAFAPAEAARLEALRDAAIEDRIDAELGLGRHDALVGELEALVAREPLRERRRAQLMLALYRAGRQGDALETFRAGARVVDAELGLRPGAELVELQQAILAGDPALAAAAPPAGGGPVVARRVTATVLFTDLAGSTPMRVALGDAAADAVRREHDGRLRDALALHGGREVKTLGDGLMAVLDGAGAALACAVDMQRAVDRQSRRGPVALGLRIGLGAGDVAWEGDDCFGTPVVEAQRLCAAAGAGEILAADAVRLLAGEAADALRETRDLELPGLPRAVRAWVVPWSAERAVSVPVAPALATDADAPFAGRDAELEAADGAWRAAADGRRGVLVLSGEPGIGKTRLAAEIAARAGRAGAIVLYGRCADGLAAPAQPFAEALGAYVAACPVDELRVQLGQRAADLHPVLPGLAASMPGVPPAAPTDPETERLRVAEAVAALLTAAAETAPLLLVLDDLHWADELSLQLLRHVAAHVPVGTPLLVLATYRDTERSRSPLLADVVAGLARQPGVASLALGPLDEPAVAALLAHAGRAADLSANVRAVTRGNPFFVREVVHALAEGAAPLTPRVRDTVRGRLAQLPPGVADLLAIAAVAGPEFDLDVVARAARLDTERALDAIEAAERARLVVPAGAPDRFGFAHALVREAIIGELPATRRVRHHARIAGALEHAATTRVVPVGELAVHLDAAGGLVDAGATRAAARRAGDEATRRLAFDVAAAHYERALRAHDRLPDATDEERRDLALAHARALRLAGDARAYDRLRRVVAEADAAGDGRRMAEALLTTGLGLETDFLHEDTETIALLRRALALLPPGDGPERARLLGYLALLALYSVSDAERSAIAAEAVAMARRTGDAPALASTLASHSWTVMDPERARERLAVADELIALRAPGWPYPETDGQIFRYIALVELGDIAGADAALAAGRAAARVPIAQWTVTQWAATRAILRGDLGQAEELTMQGVLDAQAAGMPPTVVSFTAASLIWCVRWLQGRLSELDQLASEALVRPDRPAWSFVSEAQLAQARGDRAAAAEHLAEALRRGLLTMPRAVSWAGTMTFAADVCTWLGDVALAGGLHALLAPCAGTLMPASGPIGRAVAGLARTLGRPDEAEHRLREAVALCARTNAEAHLAIARLELGTLLGASDEGRRLVAEAGAAAERLGLVGVRAMAAAV